MTKYPELVFKTLAMPIVFALLAIGFHFFLRGHNAPGGGFIAGLIVAVTALLARMSLDRQLLKLEPLRLVPLGLLIAVSTGIYPMFFKADFLRSAHGHSDWVFVGSFEWASAALFDLGVFLVVIGATLTIIDLLAEDFNKEGET